MFMDNMIQKFMNINIACLWDLNLEIIGLFCQLDLDTNDFS